MVEENGPTGSPTDAPSSSPERPGDSNESLLNSPPVAPAVVVDESNNHGVSYPVATFVRDLVRTGMEHFADRRHSHTATTQPETLPLSIRSVPADWGRPNHEISTQQTQFQSTPTMSNDLSEYHLVGGELVLLPSSNHVEDLVREQLQNNQDLAQTCQPKRFKKGVKKIAKFFTKKKKTKKKKKDIDISADFSLTSSYSSNTRRAAGPSTVPPTSPPPVTGLPSTCTGLAAPTSTTNDTDSVGTPKRNKKNKSFWGRNRRDSRSVTPPPGEDPQWTTSEEFSLQPGLEPPSTSNTATLPPLHASFETLEESTMRPALPPMQPIRELSASGRTESVYASYVGTTTDNTITAESFVEDDDDDEYRLKRDDGLVLPESLVAPAADLKVDKSETPDVEAFLHRAMLETDTDLRFDSDSLPVFSYTPRAPTDSVPLTESSMKSEDVHNDVLKIVMVAAQHVDKNSLSRKIRNSNKRPRKIKTLALDVHEWCPNFGAQRSPVKCSIWDVQGATSRLATETQSNFGAHAGTQSLFFSPQCLYILVWDLGHRNDSTYFRRSQYDSDDDDEDEEEDDGSTELDANDFHREESSRQADRALRADINNRVISWCDCIAQRCPQSAILPVALIPPEMDPLEVKRRCATLQKMLEDLSKTPMYNYHENPVAPRLLNGNDNSSVLSVVDDEASQGIESLREMILAIANDPERTLFQHVGTQVPFGTALVRDAVHRFKENHKIILLDHLLGEIQDHLSLPMVVDCLHFLASIGEVLYFGHLDDEVLAQFIILERKWLISALSCILRNDLRRELIESRCFYSEQQFEENKVIQTLMGDTSVTTSNCPLLSTEDAAMLWQSMTFMREASDKSSKVVETSTTAPTMFYFLERLLTHSGVFLPLGTSSQNASLNHSEVYFVPSLLAQADPTDLWTYRSSEAFMTTLCHSWLFRDGAPPNLMEFLSVGILRDLYEFTSNRQAEPLAPARHNVSRTHSMPVDRDEYNEFMDEHKVDTAGRVRIHHVVCFKSKMLVKIGTIFSDPETGLQKERFVEIFIAVVDQNSEHCVASDVMRPSMRRVIVSGKGQEGHHGRNLWKGGYKMVLESIRRSLSDMSNVDAQVLCPTCLHNSNPRVASTWGWDSVLAVATSGHPHVICVKGHRINSNLICGTSSDRKPTPVYNPEFRDILPSVVLVGIWDPYTRKVVNVGSGFVLDKKLGLVVTAAHVPFVIDDYQNEAFGKPYLGIRGGRAVVGIIPETGGKDAAFRYFADIVAADVHNVDACVLQLSTRFDRDRTFQDDDVDTPITETTIPEMLEEGLQSIKLTKHFEREESIRIVGYQQGKPGEINNKINLSVDSSLGYIRRKFTAVVNDDSYSSDSSAASHAFAPREEIVVVCKTIAGISGGPCINNDGKVIGILSRSDPSEKQQCYVVPATEIKPLVKKAKAMCLARVDGKPRSSGAAMRPGGHTGNYSSTHSPSHSGMYKHSSR